MGREVFVHELLFPHYLASINAEANGNPDTSRYLSPFSLICQIPGLLVEEAGERAAKRQDELSEEKMKAKLESNLGKLMIEYNFLGEFCTRVKTMSAEERALELIKVDSGVLSEGEMKEKLDSDLGRLMIGYAKLEKVAIGTNFEISEHENEHPNLEYEHFSKLAGKYAKEIAAVNRKGFDYGNTMEKLESRLLRLMGGNLIFEDDYQFLDRAEAEKKASEMLTTTSKIYGSQTGWFHPQMKAELDKKFSVAAVLTKENFRRGVYKFYVQGTQGIKKLIGRKETRVFVGESMAFQRPLFNEVLVQYLIDKRVNYKTLCKFA